MFKDDAGSLTKNLIVNQTFYSWILKQAENFGDEGKKKFDKIIKPHFPLKDATDASIKQLKTPTVATMKDISEKGILGEYVPTAYNSYRLLSQYEHYSIVSRKFMERSITLDIEQFTVAIDCVLLLQYFVFNYYP